MEEYARRAREVLAPQEVIDTEEPVVGDIYFCSGCLAYWKIREGDKEPLVTEVVTAAGPEWRLFCPSCTMKLDTGRGCYTTD